jgi:UDP-glucose 4-epimerase
MKTALVTGASGFIGDHLCRALRGRGVRVRAVARAVAGSGPWDEAVACDLTAPLPAGLLRGMDAVFHLAGKAHALDEIGQDEGVYHAANVQSTRALLDAAGAEGAHRFVFFSSVKAMGEVADERTDESAPERPETAYGRSKLEAENLVRAWGRAAPARHAAVLRLVMVYGVGNKGNLARMIAAIDRGLFPPLPEVGNRRSIVHVDNVVQAALLAAEREEANGRAYIVTDGREWSTREMYDAIRVALGQRRTRVAVPLWALRTLAVAGDVAARVRGRRLPFDSDALQKMTGSAWYDSSLLVRELGYRPTIGLAEALPAVIAWYRSRAR